MPNFVKVAALSDVPPGTIKGVEVNGERIALCNAAGTLCAVKDECTHAQFPLTYGDLEGKILTCALHGAQFEVTSGRAVGLPAIEPVQSYPVKVEGEEVYIAVD